jgi:cell division protein FtsW
VLFAVVGLAAWSWRRAAGRVYRRRSLPGLIVALVALVLVLVIGHEVAGQRNWIDIGGPFRFQPSEFAKLALVLWASDLLARKQPLLDQWKNLLVPLMPVSLTIIGLVLLEGDFGTALILVPMVAAMLWVNGAPFRLFFGGAIVMLAGVALLSYTQAYRLKRFSAWLDPPTR